MLQIEKVEKFTLTPVDPQDFSTLVYLYNILRARLLEPGANITHLKMPTWEEHVHFVQNPPYQRWDIIGGEHYYERYGIAYVTKRDIVQHTIGNEVGIYLSEPFRGKGLGHLVLAVYKHHYPFLLANIAKTNTNSAKFFRREGFTLVNPPDDDVNYKQRVYAWERKRDDNVDPGEKSKT